MEPPLPTNCGSSNEFYSKTYKRKRVSSDSEECDSVSAARRNPLDETEKKKPKDSPNVIDYSNPFAVTNMLDTLNTGGKYGSVTKDLEAILSRSTHMLSRLFALHPGLSNLSSGVGKRPRTEALKVPSRQLAHLSRHNFIDLEDDSDGNGTVLKAPPVVVLDSDDEDKQSLRPLCCFQEIVLGKPSEILVSKEKMVGESMSNRTNLTENANLTSHIKDKSVYVGVEEKVSLTSEVDLKKGNGDYVGVEEKVSLTSEIDLKKEKGGVEGKVSLTSEIDLKKEKGGVEEKVSLSSEIDLKKEKCNHVGVEEKVSLTGEIDLKKDKGDYVGVEENVSLISEIDLKKDKGDYVGVEEKISLTSETDLKKDKGVYVGVEEDADSQPENEDDGLQDIWQTMSMALELSKDGFEDLSSERVSDDEDCDHSFVLKDDLGYVCRICGVIDRGIETIIDIQYNKAKKSTRTYASERRNGKTRESGGTKFMLYEDDFTVTDIVAHPRHMKQLKPHQLEGFNFLVSNLVKHPPGGCILAHAPGSGKTFMIISFMQTFLVQHPGAKPLVVLPKGIVGTWKKEFQTWQVEDILLLDLYSVKAENRSQQFDVLQQWAESKNKSILFLGYKQFSTIICNGGNDEISTSCREILLKRTSILICDEGHTPRNEATDQFESIAKVKTPLKVVLSGTLYQNHVKEVFNILNLVRPKFLWSDTSKPIAKRIMSIVQIPGARKRLKPGADEAFYDSVEFTLQKDENFERKVSVIHDLREMTCKVLHYYKGDFLDELPGLVDFTAILCLTPTQKDELEKLKRKNLNKFKMASVGSAVYLHPKLDPDMTDDKMDELLNKLDIKEGAKAKFFVNMLNLCESAGEKLLVFSQYLTPLKFLRRLSMKMKGWHPGTEIFSITGESSADERELSMDRFNNSPDSRVFFGSIKACGEGISLVGASRIIILDVHLNPSVTRQAIGRAFRPGQKKKVYVYRLTAGDSLEEEDHTTSSKKELISKMWFEWNRNCGNRDFNMETVDVNECDDIFLESPLLREDIRTLYRR